MKSIALMFMTLIGYTNQTPTKFF